MHVLDTTKSRGLLGIQGATSQASLASSTDAAILKQQRYSQSYCTRLVQ